MKKKPKPYHSHEIAYQKMQKKGISSWDEFGGYPEAIEPNFMRFIEDAAAQEWFPKPGSMIELGCGTAPVLRWFNDKGWKGAGVDISPQAIRMAKRQSKGRGLKLHAQDVTRLETFEDESFDFALDGHCLHCIVEKKDRKAFMSEARRVLKPGGLLLVDTMCAPVQGKRFRENYGPLVKGVVLAPVPGAEDYAGAKKIDGKWHIPTRFIDHWKNILKDLHTAGFTIMLFRVNTNHPTEAISNLSVVAAKNE
jgi:ubiquinone/menaquinone biosynthesis C-methylase UbiE